jgi:hypothetical protein
MGYDWRKKIKRGKWIADIQKTQLQQFAFCSDR